MKILTFFSSFLAGVKLKEYADLARNPDSPEDFALTGIVKHTTQEIWWFNGTDCSENGGIHKDEIAEDILQQDFFEVGSYPELIDMGYLPSPDF